MTIKIKTVGSPDVCGGTELYSGVMSIPELPNNPWRKHTLTMPVDVTAGTAYFVEFTGTAAQYLRLTTGDDYPNGALFYTLGGDVCTEYASQDISLELDIAEASCEFTPSDIIVNGFECFGPNGIYTPNGELNGAPMWVSQYGPGNFQIVWSSADSHWEIRENNPFALGGTGGRYYLFPFGSQ